MKDALSTEAGKRFGEVVEAATSEFTTQCYRLYEAPPLGSLVRCGDDSVAYGVVYDVANRSMDPARHPIPRGEDEISEEALYLSNPQLERLLYTELRSVVVGHRSGGELRREPSPLPPRIHSFVYRCDGPELREFSSSPDFLPTLLNTRGTGAQDDVVAAFLRQAGEVHEEPRLFMVDAGKELAILLANNLPRLNNVLKRLAQ